MAKLTGNYSVVASHLACLAAPFKPKRGLDYDVDVRGPGAARDGAPVKIEDRGLSAALLVGFFFWQRLVYVVKAVEVSWTYQCLLTHILKRDLQF